MSEKEPQHIANLSLPDGEKIPVTTENAHLYQHMGKFAVYDHIFVTVGEENGLFIWAQQPPDNPNYINLAPTVVESGCELHLNIRQPSSGDINIFEKHSLAGIDEAPDWLPPIA